MLRNWLKKYLPEKLLSEGHWQEEDDTVFESDTHTPPFWHGLGVHGLICVWVWMFITS